MSKRQERCETCKWWAADEEDSSGLCHRFPPVIAPKDSIIVQYGDGSELSYWHYPETHRSSFCGEYSPTTTNAEGSE